MATIFLKAFRGRRKHLKPVMDPGEGLDPKRPWLIAGAIALLLLLPALIPSLACGATYTIGPDQLTGRMVPSVLNIYEGDTVKFTGGYLNGVYYSMKRTDL